MQVTSYDPHLGLLRSEHCWGEHRTVYSDRREAGAVMASIRPFRSGCGGPILGPCRRSSTRLVLSQAGAALCQLGTIFDFKTLELVAAHTGTKAGLSDSILVTQPGVGLWGRQEFHANSKKIRHPLCQPHQGICGDYYGGSALRVAAADFAFFTDGSPPRQLSIWNGPA